MPDMYVRQEANNLYALRQVRYKPQLAAGREHPHDMCAISGSLAELRRMCIKHWPDVDYDNPEPEE